MRRFSTTIHVGQPGPDDRISILKSKWKWNNNTFHSLTDNQFKVLGEKTNMFSGSDVTRVAIDSINYYYQQVLAATHFQEVLDDKGNVKYEPLPWDSKEKGKPMTYKDLKQNELHDRKITFECVEEVLKQSKPTVGSSEVNKHRRFEMLHPAVSVLRGKKKLQKNEQEKKSQEIEPKKKTQETSVLRKEPKKKPHETSVLRKEPKKKPQETFVLRKEPKKKSRFTSKLFSKHQKKTKKSCILSNQILNQLEGTEQLKLLPESEDTATNSSLFDSTSAKDLFIVEDFATEDSMQEVADLSLDETSDEGLPNENTSSIKTSEQSSLSTVPIEDEHSFSEMKEQSSLSTVPIEDKQSFSEMKGTITSYLLKMADLYQVQEFHDLSVRFEELIRKHNNK